MQQARTRMMRSCQLAESGVAMAAHPFALNGAPSKSLKEAAAILGIAGSDTSLLTFLQTLESTKRFHVLQKPTLNHQPAVKRLGLLCVLRCNARHEPDRNP